MYRCGYFGGLYIGTIQLKSIFASEIFSKTEGISLFLCRKLSEFRFRINNSAETAAGKELYIMYFLWKGGFEMED